MSLSNLLQKNNLTLYINNLYSGDISNNDIIGQNYTGEYIVNGNVSPIILTININLHQNIFLYIYGGGYCVSGTNIGNSTTEFLLVSATNIIGTVAADILVNSYIGPLNLGFAISSSGSQFILSGKPDSTGSIWHNNYSIVLLQTELFA
jgi:hypothetical protein